MLKSTVIEPKGPQEPELEFPLLARFMPTGMVALFTENCKGTVVEAGSSRNLGDFSCTWTFGDFHYDNSWEILPKGYIVQIEVE